jgi:hypothetical protein
MPDPAGLLERLTTLEQVLPEITARLAAAADGSPTRPSTAPSSLSRQAFPPPKLTCLHVHSSVHGTLTFDRLPENGGGLCVGELKRLVYERLLLGALVRVNLSVHGRRLDDDDVLLLNLGMRQGTVIELSTSRLPRDAIMARGLKRVRVASTALSTRQLVVDERTTVIDLKLAWSAAIAHGEHTWFTKEGFCIRKSGATVVAVANAKADDKAGTSALRMGDELLADVKALRNAKAAACPCFKVSNGRPVSVLEAQVVELALPPEKIWISWCGLTLPDDEVLFNAGVRTDDELLLEFLSPATPPVLQILRLPSKEKGGKKGKGGKGKGGKKKK